MKISGIISEFNPFHSGHEYLINSVRENGYTHIVTVMGGDFLQRGNAAVMGKYARAEAAVRGGIDLVLELPQIYACASAERFARGAVNTLRACGCVEQLAFGSENIDIIALSKAVRFLKEADISEFTERGFSYPRAVCAAAEKAEDFQTAELLANPNATLAIEYIKAAGDDFSYCMVKRTVPHNESGDSDQTILPKYMLRFNKNAMYASASEIRRMILCNDDSYKKYIPKTTAEIIEREMRSGACPASYEQNERGVISILRRMSADEFRNIPDVTEGLENRIVKAVRENNTLSEIISAVKCKRYTHARLSRIITCAYLGITADSLNIEPQYIRVLAFNERGAEILKLMKKTATLPVLMNARDFGRLPQNARRILDIDLRAADLFGMCMPITAACGEDYYRGAMKMI